MNSAFVCAHPSMELFNTPSRCKKKKKKTSELELPHNPGVSASDWLVIRNSRKAGRCWEVF